MEGVLLLSHGSPVKDAASVMPALASAVQTRTSLPVVEVAYLDFTPPTIPEGVDICYQKGTRLLYVLPCFLAEGYLMKKAVRIAREAAAGYPDLQVVAGTAIGYDERVARILLARYQEAARFLK